jgi:hypothetical protein
MISLGASAGGEAGRASAAARADCRVKTSGARHQSAGNTVPFDRRAAHHWRCGARQSVSDLITDKIQRSVTLIEATDNRHDNRSTFFGRVLNALAVYNSKLRHLAHDLTRYADMTCNRAVALSAGTGQTNLPVQFHAVDLRALPNAKKQRRSWATTTPPAAGQSRRQSGQVFCGRSKNRGYQLHEASAPASDEF